MKSFTGEKAEVIDGYFYQLWRVKGRFKADYDLEKYPFDIQKLKIIFEDSLNELSIATYKYDKRDSMSVGYDIRLPGWVITGISAREAIHRYRTDFGISSNMKIIGSDATDYSQLEFTFDVSRIPFSYLIKAILPLFIIIFIAGTSYFLHPNEIEARAGICVTTLMSAIALHLTAISSMPNIAYCTIMDRYFIFSYFLILMTCLQVALTARVVRLDELRAVKNNKISSMAFYTVFVGGFILNGML